MSAADSGSGRSRLERIHLHGWDDNGGCRQTLSATSAVTRFNAAWRRAYSSAPTTAASTGSISPAARKVWEYEAASPVTSSPAVAKGKVVVATADGQVICFG